MMNEKNDWTTRSLGLPKGSVRALIALTTIGTVVYLVLGGTTEIPDWLNTIISMIIGFYFGQKAA